MNYTTLQSDVGAYLHDASNSLITTFIEAARVRIGRDLRSPEQETTGTVSSFTDGIGALPTDCMEVRAVWEGDVQLRSVNLQEIKWWASATTPAAYAIYGRNIYAPGATSLTVTYWKVEAALSSGSTEHPTMAAYPDLWRNAAVAEGYVYKRDFEAAQGFWTLYNDQVTAINAMSQRLRMGDAPAVITSDANTSAWGSGL